MNGAKSYIGGGILIAGAILAMAAKSLGQEQLAAEIWKACALAGAGLLGIGLAHKTQKMTDCIKP